MNYDTFLGKIEDCEETALDRSDVNPGEYYTVRMLGLIARILLDYHLGNGQKEKE